MAGVLKFPGSTFTWGGLHDAGADLYHNDVHTCYLAA
jgi:hypothetical protein